MPKTFHAKAKVEAENLQGLQSRIKRQTEGFLLECSSMKATVEEASSRASPSLQEAAVEALKKLERWDVSEGPVKVSLEDALKFQ